MRTIVLFALVLVFATTSEAKGKQSDYARICENPDLMFDKPLVCQEYCTLMERSCSELANHHQSGCTTQEEQDYLQRKKEKRKECIALLFGVGSECVDENCSSNADPANDPITEPTTEPTPELATHPETNLVTEPATATNTDFDEPKEAPSADEAKPDKNVQTEPAKTVKPELTNSNNNVQPTYKFEDLKQLAEAFLSNTHAVHLQISLTNYEIIALVTIFLFTGSLLQVILVCCCISPLRRENQSLQRDVRELVKKLGKANRNSPK